MKWLAAIAHSLRARLTQLCRWGCAKARQEQAPRIRYERVEDFPERLQPMTLYIAGEEPYVWAAAMLCPCGCGDSIHLNLLEQERPCWSIQLHADSSVSAVPSVWRTKGCRSHFFIRNSGIEWCRFDTAPFSGRLRKP